MYHFINIMNEKSDPERPAAFVEKPQLSIPISNENWKLVPLYYLWRLPNTSEEIGSEN
jgi:hypothetical protein